MVTSGWNIFSQQLFFFSVQQLLGKEAHHISHANRIYSSSPAYQVLPLSTCNGLQYVFIIRVSCTILYGILCTIFNNTYGYYSYLVSYAFPYIYGPSTSEHKSNTVESHFLPQQLTEEI